jgi:NAD(P)-dependent dehydrogenase (short-subunit alcohol dehydrogenase family)
MRLPFTRRSYPALDLRGAVVLVTGAARGIGRATAARFLARGARVCLADVDLDAARGAASALGENAHAEQLDVASREAFEQVVARLERDVGPLDVLVNNAGVMPLGAFVDESDATSRTTLAVNLWGPLVGMRVVLPRMTARGRGHVVNVASMAGKFPVPGAAAYVASKFGVVGLTAVVRDEVADRGVSVSAVLPSAVRTAIVSGVPLGRGLPLVEPDDVARAIVTSCATRAAEVPVPGWMAGYDALVALAPRALVDAVRRALGADRVLTSLDHPARAEYHARVAAQAVGRGER